MRTIGKFARDRDRISDAENFFYLVPDSYRIKIKKKIKQKKIFWCWQKLPSFHKKESSFSLFIVPDI